MKLIHQLLLLDHVALLHHFTDNEDDNEVCVQELLQEDLQELYLVHAFLYDLHFCIFVHRKDAIFLPEFEFIVEKLLESLVIVKLWE